MNMSQRNFRKTQFKKFQRDGVQDARQKLIRGRIQDARQILNKKAQHQNTGFASRPRARFQNQVNKQNQFRMKNRIGINKNSFIGKAKNNVITVNRGNIISRGMRQQNVGKNTGLGVRVKLGLGLKNEILQRKTLNQGKQIKLRGGSIQVTAKQPFQTAPVALSNDELEDMAISDLQEFTQLTLPSAQPRNLVGTLPPTTQLTSAPLVTASSTHTILVSNLHPSVTEDDIKELFSAVGTISSTRFLHPGAALVAYYSKDDALNACESYHNRLLDSQPMQCSLLSESERQAGRTSIASRLGGRLASQSSPHHFARVALSQYMPSTVSQRGFALRNRDPIFNVHLS